MANKRYCIENTRVNILVKGVSETSVAMTQTAGGCNAA